MPSTLGIVASGFYVFSDAVLWLDTARSVANETTMVNYGTGGSALNATYGSSAGADTNDPLLLTHSGTNYLYLPGAAGNYASTPDAAALDITGNLCLVADVALNDWTPGTTNRLGGKDTAYVLNLNSAGQLAFSYVDSGLTTRQVASTSVGFTDGVRRQVAVTYVAGSGVNDVRFWSRTLSTDAWVQIGSTQSSGGVDIRVGGNAAAFGATDTGSAPLAGRLYRFTIYASVGASNEPPSSGAVLDADFTTGITSGGQTTFTESSANAATVTINRATSGRKSVAVVRNVLLFGTDDMLEIADADLLDFGASDSFTVMAVHRAWNTQTTGTSLVAKKANTTAATQGWMLGSGTTTALQGQSQVGDGTNGTTATSASRTAGALAVSTLVRSTAADTVTTYLGSTAGTPVTDATTSTSANTEAVRVGRLSGAGTGYFDGEIIAVAIWRRALNANEIATASARYS